MSLRLAAELAERGIEVELAAGAGETLALLGPNGAGKSTLLGMLAGLVRPDHGHATLDGRTLFDLPSTWTPPHRRGVALLAQDALLFPHLTVRSNVEFGPRSAGLSRTAATARADEWMLRTGTADFADRRPSELSGGQAQRVAIARALAAEPGLLLLDEPLSALDVAVMAEVRATLVDVLAGRTTVLVTHDVIDAYLLADRVSVISGGRVVEAGPAREVLERPRHAFTAELSGLTLLTGTRTPDGLVTDDGVRLVADAPHLVSDGSRVSAVVRPSAVRLGSASIHADHAAAGPANTLPATVRALEPHADLVRVRTDSLAALVPPAVVAELDLAPGRPVTVFIDPADVIVYAP